MHSPFIHLLGTNGAPTSAHTLQIRTILAQKEIQLSSLRHEISQVQSLITNLTSKLDALTFEVSSTIDEISQHAALLSPIRRMPIEIMQEIFIHCLPSDKYITPHPMKAPLLLAQICSPWRQAVLSSPRLWNSLAVHLHHLHPPELSQQRLDLLNQWLLRTSSHLISLFAYIPSANAQDLAKFLRILNTYTTRWRDLRLILPREAHKLLLRFLNNKTASLVTLQKLEIRFSPSREAEAETDTQFSSPNLSITSDNFPHLRTFSWSQTKASFRRHHHQDLFAFHYTHITDLDVDTSLSVPACLEILQQCPQIVHCNFKAICQPSDDIPIRTSIDSDSDSPPSIILNSLNSLTIHTTQCINPFFAHLLLPSLRILHITDLTRDEEGLTMISRVWSQSQSQGPFISFVQRSQCGLEVLHLMNILSNEEELVECLRGVGDSLRELRLGGGGSVVRDRVLGLLTVEERDVLVDGWEWVRRYTCLCPNLEVMKLGTCLCSSDGVLAGMVESRYHANLPSDGYGGGSGIVRLKSINPRLDSTHPQDLERLIALTKRGLELL